METETETQLTARVRNLVARSKADPRPSLTSEQARRYLDERLDKVIVQATLAAAHRARQQR